MGSIHGITYVILGVLITGVSYFIDNKNNSNSLILFFYVGIVFILLGMIKLLLKYLKNRNSNTKHKHVHHTNHTGQDHVAQQHQPICSHCNSRLRISDVYCPMCGYAIHSLR